MILIGLMMIWWLFDADNAMNRGYGSLLEKKVLKNFKFILEQHHDAVMAPPYNFDGFPLLLLT